MKLVKLICEVYMQRFFKFKETCTFYNSETKDKLFSIYSKDPNGFLHISDDGKNFFCVLKKDLIQVDIEDEKSDKYMKDQINHPGHYTSGKYETIDIIKDSVDDYKSLYMVT